jgi:hypothetical protein
MKPSKTLTLAAFTVTAMLLSCMFVIVMLLFFIITGTKWWRL